MRGMHPRCGQARSIHIKYEAALQTLITALAAQSKSVVPGAGVRVLYLPVHAAVGLRNTRGYSTRIDTTSTRETASRACALHPEVLLLVD